MLGVLYELDCSLTTAVSIDPNLESNE